MDFMNRGVRNNAQSDQLSNSPSPAAGDKKAGKLGKAGFGGSNLGKVGSMGFLLLIVVLFVLAIFSLVMFKGNEGEQKAVDKTKFQAVFLNGGQVYFGKIGELNGKYMSVKDIYYLRVNQQVQPNANTSTSSNDISLVKLGCELHGPQDQMLINREQVIFWENLKDDGQVAKAIGEYRKQYPDGQKCEDQQSQSTNQSGDTTNNQSTNTTNSTTTNTNTTSTPTTNNSTNTTNNTTRR